MAFDAYSITELICAVFTVIAYPQALPKLFQYFACIAVILMRYLENAKDESVGSFFAQMLEKRFSFKHSQDII